MTRPLAKIPLARPRATTAGLPPPSPDVQSVPASARPVPERTARGLDTADAQLDRARRLARSDPQARYGNAEVARVALQQTPPPAATRGVVAPRTLPQAGPVAHGKGHGKPSANPGAARAAVEARAATDKAKKATDDKADRKAPGPARHGAAAPAGAGHGAHVAAAGNARGHDREEAGAGDAGGGAADEGVSSGGAAASFAAALAASPRRPALEGTDAARLSIPPLADAQRERVRLQTGLTIAEHYARTQVALDRLASRAASEQFAIVVHIELAESALRRDLDNAAARIGPAVDGAIDRVRGACGAARTGLSAASAAALKTVEAHASEADRHVDATAMTSRDAVAKAVQAASPQVRALHEETMAPLREMLVRQGKVYAALARTKGIGLLATGSAMATAMNRNGGALELAQAEKRQGVATANMMSANEEFIAAGQRAEQDILAQEASLGLSFLMFVNPVAVKLEHVGGEDGKTVVDKGGEVRLRLANDHERAKGTVDQTTQRGLKALDALEHSAVQQLRTMGRGLEAMAAQRRDQLSAAVLDGRASAAEAWAQQMKGVNELVESGQVVDWRRLEPRLTEAMAAFDALSTHQRLDFDARARSGVDEAGTGMDGDRRTLDEAADSFVGSAQDTRRQTAAMTQIAEAFGKPLHGMAGTTAGITLAFRTRTEEKLGLAVDETRKQMAGLLTATEASLAKTGLAAFGARLDGEGKTIQANVGKLLEAVDEQVIKDLADRATRCYAAMDGVGTDETGLFAALHGMTPVFAKALEEHWINVPHDHDLWWWLDDELSGDEYTTASWYLKGDPVQGAAFEVKASFHWYGDDVKQMESALRGLPPEQAKALADDPAFASCRDKVESSLKGTNLQVVQALLAGRTMRADALRLKEQIDAARAAGDDDKLHDLLSRVDPHALPQMRTEFLDVLAGHAMTKDAPVTSSDQAVLATEAAAFATYVTAPVEVWEPGTGEYDEGRYVTRTLGADSARLATALATTGEGSPDARAARLAYEAARGGKPRPDKLAIALDDPELVKARANPVLRSADTKAPDYLEAKQALDRLEARRAEVMTKFTELTSKDKDLARDPASARDYTAHRVAAMFGDDALGRELGASMVKDGRAKPAVAIKYAVRGWGTNEELIRKTLRDMSAQEIKELKADYALRFGGDTHDPDALYNDLGVFQNADTAKAAGVKAASGGGFFTELSGDDRQEVEEMLLGVPENDRDRMRLARLQYAHQRGEGTTWATGALLSQADGVASGLRIADRDQAPGTSAGEALDTNKARMERMLADSGGEENAFDEHGNFKPTAQVSSNDFRVRVASTSETAANYKHHVDSIASMITGAIALIGAIVGTIVVTVLTLGTATPLVIGLWAAGIAAATGAASMATRYALKGGRYGWEEAAVDGALTLVDAATAGLTAGAGAKAARAATELAALKAAARTAAQEEVAEGLVKAQARKEVVRGFVRSASGAGVGGAARTATTDGTWDDGFLSGLGRTVRGGVESAAVGLAAHGASHAFSQSGLGKSLDQSTSYLRRGLGTGLGGAIGGMAGRGTEVALDAAQGRKQAPWDEVLGSIALAGGRGFAENVGQGIASVPHARREAAQQAREAALRLQDDTRVARLGMSSADEQGDRAFRRNALAAALRDDPQLDRRAFLAELDAGVARDRAFVEQNRQLARQFRREALASIPPARRGEFADVDIRIVSDADFERLTGSRSGRAVTLIEDGQARIVVRRGATPETLREEGIHVLQSREPQWRQRVARLDEATLSRWDELDLETQLALYRNKLEIEVDAQRRLRRELVGEADRAADPARRRALLDRAEVADRTLQSLTARRDEVEAIGPQRRASMARGEDEPPQYLREPARLFSKTKAAADEPVVPKSLAEESPGTPVHAQEPPAEAEPAKPRTIHELRIELERLRTALGADPAEIAAREKELAGHYEPRPGETLRDLAARVLARRDGETNAAYGRRLRTMAAEVGAGATHAGQPGLHAAYERLLKSLARPLDAVRADVERLAATPNRTKAQQKRLAEAMDELDAHYGARPGEGVADVEARVLARRGDENDAVYRLRLLGLRGEVADQATKAGHPDMLARLDTLTRQLRRPPVEVRTEIDGFERLNRPLTEAETAQLKALEEEWQEHYIEQPGESDAELEQRLFAQQQRETLDDYLVRLKAAEAQVFSGVQRTGSERVLDHYLRLVDEVEQDIARRPALRVQAEKAQADAVYASRCRSAHRRAMLEQTASPNLPYFSEDDVAAVWDRHRTLAAELAGLENRGTARSARYTFADVGQVDPCFVLGTLVETPDGPRPIEALQAGDLVLARSPDAAPVPARVLQVHGSATRAVVSLSIAGETIRTTREHPFWSVDQQAWRPALALEPGEVLLTRWGPLALEAVVVADDLQPTLNLEVEGLHTFLVGACGVLVHNGGGVRRPDFADLVKRPTRIYRVIRIVGDGKRIVIYVGKTWQGDRGDVQVRFGGHLRDKPEWAKWYSQKTSDGGPRLIVEVEKSGSWTVFETAVWEEHFIRKYRANRVDLGRIDVAGVALENTGVPLTKDAFNLYRSRFAGC